MNDQLLLGMRNRNVAYTAMNANSGRSHCIFSIVVEYNEQGTDGSQSVRKGTLNMVNLAGGERLSKTAAAGERAREAVSLNQSLKALVDVLSALADPKIKHIPFRSSKLTKFMQESLAGNTNVLMIANVSPVDWNHEETLSTLRLASRTKEIKALKRVNEAPAQTKVRQTETRIRPSSAIVSRTEPWQVRINIERELPIGEIMMKQEEDDDAPSRTSEEEKRSRLNELYTQMQSIQAQIAQELGNQ
eukprot:TRINITY_DN3735_c0_g1_i8.p1 TRINITY_DN3735_c0_g1~~TRINITY_DN3735_c0_g1_i8.p1  ORF type:complete len:246 (-),score=53.35 TRINITY_DN3735_c0_g1_i8:190-927(-)